jgi:hypothetical protein
MMKSGTIIRKLDLIEQEFAKLRGLPCSNRKAHNRKDTLRKRRKRLSASLLLVELIEKRRSAVPTS